MVKDSLRPTLNLKRLNLSKKRQAKSIRLWKKKYNQLKTTTPVINKLKQQLSEMKKSLQKLQRATSNQKVRWEASKTPEDSPMMMI